MVSKWDQIKGLQERLRHKKQSQDNLHRIAISNLDNQERVLERWWSKKYRTPLRPYEDHTQEELMIEMLEDYYEANPSEIERFYDSIKMESEEWNGRMSEEYERGIKERIEKINKNLGIDISQFQSDEVVSDEDFEKMMNKVGKNLPKSRQAQGKIKSEPTLGSDEFDEVF